MTGLDGPLYLIGVENNYLRDVVFGDLVDRLRLELRGGVSTMVQVLGGNNMTCALPSEDPNSPLRNNR